MTDKDKLLTQINAQREEICKAFVAKTGLEPDECEQVQETEGTTIRWYLRKRQVNND